ncbi:Uncharacterised protein [uncultured archaeon]|nr:Uncharacterised protein [uncultured archaeon]
MKRCCFSKSQSFGEISLKHIKNESNRDILNKINLMKNIRPPRGYFYRDSAASRFNRIMPHFFQTGHNVFFLEFCSKNCIDIHNRYTFFHWSKIRSNNFLVIIQYRGLIDFSPSFCKRSCHDIERMINRFSIRSSHIDKKIFCARGNLC